MRRHSKILFLTLTCLTGLSAFGQVDKIKAQVDSLKYLGDNAFDCNSVYWRIIAHNKDAIPYLINKISDTTVTTAKDRCKKTNLKVGDLAYLALEHIFPLPISSVAQMQFDVMEDNCQLFVWDYIETNRAKFKTQVQKWYDTNFKTYKWVKFSDKALTNCYRKNKIYGQYK